GSLDTTFGGNNTGISPKGFGPVALAPDGDIVLGQPNYSGGSRITRFLPDGTTDPAFGSAGTVTLSYVFGALAIQPDGKIDVAGNTSIPDGRGHATPIGFMVDRLLPGEPQIGSLTISASTVTAGSNVTVTASNIADDNPGAVISQVAFYVDSNGDG